MSNNVLTVIEQREILGKDFKIYGSLESPVFLAKDVAAWIEHSDVSTMLKHIDDEEKLTQALFVSGQNRDSWFVTEDGLYEILMLSRKPVAKQFKKKVKEVMKSVRKHGAYMTQDVLEKALSNPDFIMQLAQKLQSESTTKIETMTTKIESLETKIDSITNSVLFKPYTDEHARFTALQVRFFIHLRKKVFPRGFYDALQDYFGVHIPSGDDLKPMNMRVYEYILAKIDIDDIEIFVCGVEQDNIVKSTRGHWFSLCGYTTNNIEYQRTLRKFNNSCAYCGSTEDLVAEHIVPKSVMSQFNPEKVNQIGNICPSCSACNESKYTHDFTEWFPRQASYSVDRHRKVTNQTLDYQI